MNMKLLSKRTWVVLGVFAVAATAAVGGYAYWTTSGEGTGTADTGTTADFVVTQLDPAPVDLVPGGPPQDVSIDVENTEDFNQYLTSLTFEIDPAWSEDLDGVGVGNPPCTDDDFTLVQPTVANVDLSPGNHNGVAYTGSIALDNTASNQDNCKSVSVDLLVHAN